MALVAVEVVNNSDQVVRLSLEEDSEQLDYLRKQARREDIKSVKVLPAARKTAAK